MSETADHLDARRKRLLWRAMHRGIKEMDIIVGGFAQSTLQHMSDVDLAHFEQILDTPDQDLLAWLTQQEAVPDASDSPLLQKLLAYRPQN